MTSTRRGWFDAADADAVQLGIGDPGMKPSRIRRAVSRVSRRSCGATWSMARTGRRSRSRMVFSWPSSHSRSAGLDLLVAPGCPAFQP